MYEIIRFFIPIFISQGPPGIRGLLGEKGDQGDPGEDGRNVRTHSHFQMSLQNLTAEIVQFTEMFFSFIGQPWTTRNKG